MVWHVAYSFKVTWSKIESFIYLQNSPHAYLPLENTFTVMNSFSSFIFNFRQGPQSATKDGQFKTLFRRKTKRKYEKERDIVVLRRRRRAISSFHQFVFSDCIVILSPRHEAKKHVFSSFSIHLLWIIIVWL